MGGRFRPSKAEKYAHFTSLNVNEHVLIEHFIAKSLLFHFTRLYTEAEDDSRSCPDVSVAMNEVADHRGQSSNAPIVRRQYPPLRVIFKETSIIDGDTKKEVVRLSDE
jgi:hypothetical protein